MIKGTIVAQLLLYDGEEVGEYMKCSISDISHGTTDYNGAALYGTLSLPTTGQVEPMQITIDTSGVSAGGAMLRKPGTHDLEIRGVQDKVLEDGHVVTESTRIYIKGVHTSAAPGDREKYSRVEGSAVFEILRYQEFVDGEEITLIDKLNWQHKINGEDYAADIKSLLGK